MNSKLGPYNLIGMLGRGGMGVVYKAFETSLNRFVAVKMLTESLSDDEGVKERFLREARSMAALNDSLIIQIYFIGEDAGQPFFVMEFVDGESLSSLLKRTGKLKPEQAAKIIYQTAQGLATAHDRGVIHRDIKPANLMITKRGGVKIADFGIALSARDFSKKLTSTGEFVGTPGYLSPEVCLSKPVDQRSDIFSLGIVLFECLAGRMPFTDESPLGLMLEVVKAEIPDVRQLNAEVDAEIARILGKMIAKEPIDRYQSGHELVDDLAKHPLVAKGGAIGLATNPSVLEPLRYGTNRSNVAIAPPAFNSRSSNPAAGDAPTATHAMDLVVSSPLLKRDVRLPTSRSKHYWAAGAALGLVAVASAWAFRNDLPFSVPPLSSSPEVPMTTPSMYSTSDAGNTSNQPMVAMTTNPTQNQSPSLSATDADPALIDAMWLNDVPDELLESASTSPRNSFGPPYPAAVPGPGYGPMYSPYSQAALITPAPIVYQSAAPWRIGFGFGIGIGYWATRVIAPAPVYVGPLLQPGFAWQYPVSSITPAPAAPAVAVAPRSIPAVAPTAILASRVPATNIASTSSPPTSGAISPLAHRQSNSNRITPQQQIQSPRVAANIARANAKYNAQKLPQAASLRVHPAVQHPRKEEHPIKH